MPALSDIKNRVTAALGHAPILKQAARWAYSRAGVIFAFHRILPKDQECFDPEMTTSEEMFSDFLDWVGTSYQVVPLNEILDRQKKDTKLCQPICAITFDDGWHDNYLYAFPQLIRRRLPATVFLPVRFIGTPRRFWQEQLWFCMQAIPDGQRTELIGQVSRRFPWFPRQPECCNSYGALKRLLLTRPSTEAEEFTQFVVERSRPFGDVAGRAFLNWDEVKVMQEAGVQFGSHTLNHTLLPNASPWIANAEVSKSREELSARLGSEVNEFSYPWGASGPHASESVQKSGYAHAVTTQPGLVQSDSNPFLLSRIPISTPVLDGGFKKFDSGKIAMSLAKNIVTNYRNKKLLVTSAHPGKKTKILFIIDLITEWEGGTERQLQLLVSSLDKNYFEPVLCFIFDAPELPQNTLPCKLRVLCGQGTKIPPLPLRLWRLARLIRGERPQIVQTFFIEGLLLGILGARIAGVPRIVGSLRNAGHWEKLRHKIFMKLVKGFVHCWQTNSRELWRHQVEVEGVSPRQIEILPNGVDLSRFGPPTRDETLRLRRELDLNEDGPICVSVANLTGVKDFPTLIEAAGLLQNSCPNIQFVILGDGPLRGELEQLVARRGLQGVVKFVGRQADVRPYLAAANLGVLTSRSEGSSNAVLEYMAMGLPSVLSDIPANRELTLEVLFRPGNAKDLAEKILQLWQDQKMRERLSVEYRELAVEYSIEKFTNRAQSFYSRLASQ
jgi:glycosyltransferase involved in cell wall biosynthesis/peptidoglycan/xylan/chitin deacetylase (PgdA/CDA1 family)